MALRGTHRWLVLKIEGCACWDCKALWGWFVCLDFSNETVLTRLNHFREMWTGGGCSCSLGVTCWKNSLYMYSISILLVLSLSVCNYSSTMLVASMDGTNFFSHAISKEKSCDQDGLNQTRVRSVCKTKCFPNIKCQSTILMVTLIH